MVGELHGKAALVTGAGTGIGRATALALAEAGANVLVHYSKSKEDADIVVKLVKDLGRQAYALQADFADRASVAGLAEAATDHWGKLDILVNNAGWVESAVDAETNPGDLLRHLDSWDRSFDVNLRAPFELTARIAKTMRERRCGCIVNVGSTSGLYALTDAPLYSLTKAGLLHLTRQAARMYAPHVRVNAVAPGWVDTDFGGGFIRDPEFQKQIARDTPLRRLASPEEIAETILFLIKGPHFVTGTTLVVDGGMVSELR